MTKTYLTPFGVSSNLSCGCLLRFAIILISLFAKNSYGAVELTGLVFSQVQSLRDGSDHVDGLDNARFASLSPDNEVLIVVSSDDNAMATFDVSPEFNLKFSKIYNRQNNVGGLEGAISMVFSKNGQFAYVVSYYDIAVVVFSRKTKGEYQLTQVYNDGIDKYMILKEDPVIKTHDKSGLMFAYDIAINHTTNQLYVSASASNALTILNIMPDGTVSPFRSYRDQHNKEFGIGGAISVAVSSDGTQIIVAGYYENALSIFDVAPTGELTLTQTIRNQQNGIESLINPQGLSLSPDNKQLYVTCGEANALLIFTVTQEGHYKHIQTLQNTDKHSLGLGGAGNVSTSSDGKLIAVASEKEHGVAIFERFPSGKLSPHTFITDNEENLKGASSATFVQDDQFLVVTASLADSLLVYQLTNNR